MDSTNEGVYSKRYFAQIEHKWNYVPKARMHKKLVKSTTFQELKCKRVY